VFGHAGSIGQQQLADALNVRRDTIRQWLNGHVRFDAEHGAFRDLLQLAQRRTSAMAATRDALVLWLGRNRR